MPIIAKDSGGGGDFTPAPSGAHSAVCVDVVDLGEMENSFKPGTTQHKIRISWQIAENMKDGKPFLVSKRYTLSLHEKASLRHDLESWRGKPFTDAELGGFDVEMVVGVPCLLNVMQTTKEGRTYANVVSIMGLPKGVKAVELRDYTRVQDREQPKTEVEYAASDDDVPF